MNNENLSEGRISEHSRPLGTVSRDMVLERAREIAMINGRSRHEVLDSDFDQARRELLGDPDISPREEAVESVPESERWDPVPGSSGRKIPTFPEQDEETDNERLVQEGVEDAEHDQMVEGTREGIRQDRLPGT